MFKHLYTIMDFDVEHIDEICADLEYQYKNKIASCALFSMPLVPEGNPPVNKAKMMCEKYMLFKEKLDKLGVPNGVLVQCTIGHGWKLGDAFPFQRYIGITTERELETVCPYDDGFKEYIYNALQTIAACAPDHIMIDDDFRLLGRFGGGCACPLHLKRFNELAGTSFSKEELFNAITTESENLKKYQKIFVDIQREAVIETAKVMRSGIDSIDPKLPGSFCAVGTNAEFADEIAAILAGAGNPVVIRINNGNYMPAGGRNFTQAFFRAAAQIEKLKGKADIILAETDTCPQNRYSTGAMSLHSHFTGTLIEGTHGAKHWITRLITYEPESGKAYRKILSKNAGFYAAVSELSKSVKWKGFRIPVMKDALFIPGRNSNYGEDVYSAWGECVLERFGLPMYFSADNGGILCLEGKVKLTDAEIKEALSGVVFLASDSAEELITRGFGDYIGVDVKDWNGKQVTAEIFLSNGKKCARQVNPKELIITDKKAEVLSVACNSVDRINHEHLFPASVVYKNSLGGLIVTFAGTPKAAYSLTEAFGFLNYSRKEQFIQIAEKANILPAYYPGDEEVYFRAGELPSDELVCCIFNIGLDPIEETELVINKMVSKIEKLMPDGARKEISLKYVDGKYIIDTAAYTLNPVILFVK